MHRSFITILLIVCLFSGSGWIGSATAQTAAKKIPADDSLMLKKHSPRKATIFSAVLPGLGQIYNHKYWKLPIIYAGFGVMEYFIYTNTDNYLDYRSAYIESKNGNLNGNYAELVNKYSQEDLLNYAEYYHRNLEISILITALWYVLNIIDATVDAHLYTYNINENLSFQVTPDLLLPARTNQLQPGVKLCIRF